MTINQGLNLLGAAIVLIFGVACVTFPAMIARGVHWDLNGARGNAEFRVNGGLFIGLGLAALLLRDPMVYRAIGFLWIGAGVTRIVAIVLDRPKLTADYVGYIVFEFVAGVMCLA